jgi:K+-transporting ATPase KdpF subunit
VSVMHWIALLLTLGVGVYVVIALLHPDKFE